MRTQTLQGTVQIYTWDELEKAAQTLILAARDATRLSHSPYSKFRVGAALLVGGQGDMIIRGANQENASYGLSVCAERTSLFTLANSGGKTMAREMAVTGRLGTVPEAEYRGTAPLTPCGACRQVIKEYEDLAGRPLILWCDGYCDEIWRIEGIDTLLPLGFGPKDFGADLHA